MLFMESKQCKMPDFLMSIGEQIRKNAEYIMQENRQEVIQALELVQFMQEKSERAGLFALEEALEDVRNSNAPYADFLPDYILLVVDGTEDALLAEMMSNEFYVRNPDEFEAFILYIYMLGVRKIQIKSKFDLGINKEKAWEKMVRIRQEYLPVLPEECHGFFE